jgi:hypothetical protein
MKQKHTCPVCAYPDLGGPAYDDTGCPTFEICPCCGVEFGYNDILTPHAELRKDGSTQA